VSRDTALLVGLALAFAALELGSGWIPPYGLFHDELYYWACAGRPGFGYVDHPPLAPWMLAAGTALFGDGRFVFGLLPALFGAGTVFLTGWMAGRLGAGRFGQLVAGLCVAVAPFTLVHFSFFSVNAIEIFLWTLATCLLLELIRTGNQRLWLGLGTVAGIALMNKHTFALLAGALALGVVATPMRARLAGRWPWLGAAVALVLVLPNLLWNLVNDWPSLAFYRSVEGEGTVATSFAEALGLQVVGMGPAALLVWVPGLFLLLFSRAARRYRPLGIAFLILLVVVLFSNQRRGDRIAGIYPVVLAAGGAFWDGLQSRWRRAARRTLLVLLLACGALVIPATLPVLPPAQVAGYFDALMGGPPEIEAGETGHEIPQILLGRLEWERLADEVVAAWETLPREDRERAVVLAPHWLFAATVEYYGRERGLPPVVSPHNAYFFWREDAAGRDVVLAVGIEESTLSRYFAKARELGRFRCEYCANFRPDLPIQVAYGPVRPLEELLVEWRHFARLPAPALMTLRFPER